MKKDVGTFWKFENDSWYFFIIGSFEDEVSVCAIDNSNNQISFMMMNHEQTIDFIPSDNFEMNNYLIEVMGKHE